MVKTDLLKHVHLSNSNGSGAEGPNEGNLGADDAYGYDEKIN